MRWLFCAIVLFNQLITRTTESLTRSQKKCQFMRMVAKLHHSFSPSFFCLNLKKSVQISIVYTMSMQLEGCITVAQLLEQNA
jgi:hypothetical protein